MVPDGAHRVQIVISVIFQDAGALAAPVHPDNIIGSGLACLLPPCNMKSVGYSHLTPIGYLPMDHINHHRRRLLTLSCAALGLSVLPQTSLAMLSTPRPRILTLNNLNTGESLKAEFFNGKGYNSAELSRLNHFFRDYRANKVTKIDPRLFDHLYRLQVLLGSNKPVQLVSGYRSHETNIELRARSSGVAKHSYHTLGKAMDFHIEGTQLVNIRKAALKLRMGGVGYYPSSNFVHIDTGPIRTW
jgi:uncharacterized protein YcbK (DUF882 family)